MKTYSKIASKKIQEMKPTHLGTAFNSLGQTIRFFEHPTKGDESPLLCKIGEVFGLTDDYDLIDCIDNPPIFVDGSFLYQ